MAQQTESAGESASRLGRYASSTQSSQGKSDPVGNLQRFAAAEQERQKKKKKDEADAAKAKTAAGSVNTAPEKGYLSQLYDKYIGSYFNSGSK